MSQLLLFTQASPVYNVIVMDILRKDAGNLDKMLFRCGAGACIAEPSGEAVTFQIL